MANTCTNRIYFHASKETIDNFEQLIEDFTDQDFIDRFGSEGDTIIDRIGCKWIIKDDWYRDDDETYMLGFESAWYPPEIMIKNIVAELQKEDEGAYANGRYWDEGFDPIGIFQCNGSNIFFSDETTVDVDWDNETYWDDEVEPAFDKLEL